MLHPFSITALYIKRILKIQKGILKLEDILLQKFFEKERWEYAIQTAFEKEISQQLLREMSTPENRIELYHQLRDNQYKIAPPHEALIPKDNGEYRTVYVNENKDRIILSIINDMFFELCPELVHPQCKSYQKGIGCGKVVQKASSVIQHMETQQIGVKVDLSKYFDSVPIRYIDKVFDYIKNKYRESKILDVITDYYHTNTVIDIKKNLIEKYSSLRQGCAVAAFLADAVLYDIDEEISKLDVFYVRYSDDILILGNEWKKGYRILKEKLQEKELTLNPKKVEFLDKEHWFKFLGFTLKGNQISLSKSRTKSFQKEIEKRTIKNKTNNIKQILHAVNQYLYHGYQGYSWASGILPIINVEKDLQILNGFIMDAIRAGTTRKTKIGGLGVITDKPDHTILRGKGRNVTANKQKIPHIENYMTITCMRNALLTSKEAYNTLVATMP